MAAADAADLHTLACLARLGCPWGLPGVVFGSALSGCRSAAAAAAVLRRLLALGCPVDWPAAERQAAQRAAGGRGRQGWGAQPGPGQELLQLLRQLRAEQAGGAAAKRGGGRGAAGEGGGARARNGWLGCLVCGWAR
jgi:hypothetical protein